MPRTPQNDQIGLHAFGLKQNLPEPDSGQNLCRPVLFGKVLVAKGLKVFFCHPKHLMAQGLKDLIGQALASTVHQLGYHMNNMQLGASELQQLVDVLTGFLGSFRKICGQ